MGGVIATLADMFTEQVERHRNRPFLEGVMAACALIATADGDVNFPEEVRVDQILQTLDRLSVFDPHEGVDLFRDFAAEIMENPHEGHERALEAVARICGGDCEDGALLLRVCVAVSEADGNVSLAEQIEIVSLCSRFGIDPAACGLYIDMPVEEFLTANR